MAKSRPPRASAAPLRAPEWMEAQYDNRARVAEYPRIYERWREASAFSRSRASCRVDLRYGDGPNETLDLFPSPRANAPIVFFIHGGYWRSWDKSDQSFIAPSFVADGAMVVLPNYALCPAVTIEAIALQLVKAMLWTVRHAALYGGDARRVVLAGQSAGAHLSAMLLSCDWRAVGLRASPVVGALALSGLYDLEPLTRVPSLQRDLQLTPEAVVKLSPAGFPSPSKPLLALVGADESEEFLRHNALIRERWGSRAVPACERVEGANHFTILNELADPASRVHGLALQLLGL